MIPSRASLRYQATKSQYVVAATRCSSGWRIQRRTWSTSRGSSGQKGASGSCSTPQRRATQEGTGRGPRSPHSTRASRAEGSGAKGPRRWPRSRCASGWTTGAAGALQGWHTHPTRQRARGPAAARTDRGSTEGREARSRSLPWASTRTWCANEARSRTACGREPQSGRHTPVMVALWVAHFTMRFVGGHVQPGWSKIWPRRSCHPAPAGRWATRGLIRTTTDTTTSPRSIALCNGCLLDGR